MKSISRRRFVQLSALTLGAAQIGFSSEASVAAVVLVRDPSDTIAAAECVGFAATQLGRWLEQRGVKFRQVESLSQVTPGEFGIIAAGVNSPLAAPVLRRAGMRVSARPECLAFVPVTSNRTPLLLATGSDSRGLMYALLELADRVQHSDNAGQTLSIRQPIVEQPANAYRGICRPFVSDIEDKPWFHDREMWPEYFAMLATRRINRFHLALGLGYDFLQHVTDSYLLFAYPFLLDVPGYKVQAVDLADEERDRNLETLKYISRQAVAHGIDFQLGLWTHGYQFADSPNVNYTIVGLNAENQSAYCRDALALLLQKCPDISGVTLRTHYESGVKEGNYAFWKTAFEGVPKSGRKLQLDLHTKGLDQQMIDNAFATGMPIMLSPKYWAEHMGLPYHQAAIRDLEMPKTDVKGKDYSTLSEGSRIFTRYGYADFLTEDRNYEVMFRVFPGTHRFLLWGDPVSMAAHSHAFQFCGANGAELFEPLSFKGRRGSGLPGGRCAYADASLNPRRDWEKYLYTYRLWGRLLYDPNADPETWRRELRTTYLGHAPAVENALASASRILPLVITAHMPSAAHDTYTPELYTNQSLHDANAPSPYGDTPSPKLFVNVCPLDPAMFSSIRDYAAELVERKPSGRYSPSEVAQWLEDLARNTASHLAPLEAVANPTPELRRVMIDAKIQAGLGRFFAARLHSGVLFAIYQETNDDAALKTTLRHYHDARSCWASVCDAGKAYAADITYGPLPHQRGHWVDRLAAIDADIASLEAATKLPPVNSIVSAPAHAAILKAEAANTRGRFPCSHISPARFVPGEQLSLSLAIREPVVSVRLHYRRINQSERYQSVEMKAAPKEFRADIPAEYTATKFPLQYYFELRRGSQARLYPALGQKLINTPYFVVRSKSK